MEYRSTERYEKKKLKGAEGEKKFTYLPFHGVKGEEIP